MTIRNIFFKKINTKNNTSNPQIITVDHHKIKNTMIDFNALKVIGRLKKFGFEAYIVGGSVRDYLLGKKPKDFDVATNATPKQIRKYFSNSRIIGRRFKLVHIIFKDAIIETATFRSDFAVPKKTKINGLILKDNIFGSIEEDAIRRDFGINALYYDPENETIVDYVGGYEDIKTKKIKVLKKPSVSFLEDPVRMLRAVKYSALLDCKIEDKALKKIKQYSSELGKVSVSRLHEEINKILKSGKSSEIINELFKVKLLKNLIPFLYDELLENKNNVTLKYLSKLDKLVQANTLEEYELFWGVMLYQILKKMNFDTQSISFTANLKEFFMKHLSPLRVPNKVSDFLTKIFYLFFRLQSPQSRKYVKRIGRYHYFGSAKILLSIFEIDNEIINFWNNIENEKSFIFNKKKNYRSGRKTKIQHKKMVTTRNHSENIEVET